MKTAAALLIAPVLAACAVATACSQTTVVEKVDPSLADAGALPEAAADAATTSRVEGKTGKLFGAETSSYALVDDASGIVRAVGIVVPVAAFSAAPANAPFQDDLVLEMPDVAKEQTILNHVRVNWLAKGHGPTPYGEPHFDLHFQRGTVDEVDAISCRADGRLPDASLLPEGYGEPELCVDAMGQHSWPKADKGATWTGSIIMGYFAGKMAFIEPMISKAKILEKASFELAIAKPATAKGKATLYPRRLAAKYDAETKAYAFELDGFEPIDE